MDKIKLKKFLTVLIFLIFSVVICLFTNTIENEFKKSRKYRKIVLAKCSNNSNNFFPLIKNP